MKRAMGGVKLEDRRSYGFDVDVGLNKAIDCGYGRNGHLLKRRDGNVLRMAFKFEVACQRKKARPKRYTRYKLKKCIEICLNRDVLFRSKWIVCIDQYATG